MLGLLDAVHLKQVRGMVDSVHLKQVCSMADVHLKQVHGMADVHLKPYRDNRKERSQDPLPLKSG